MAYRKRARRIPRRRPSPSPIKPKPLIPNDPQHTPSPKRLRVRLPLNLEHIQRENHNLANPNQTARRGMHDGLTITPSECSIEVVPVVLGEEVAREGLPAVLVDALEDFVGSGVAEAGEEGEEAGCNGGGGGFAEDDLVELGGGGDLVGRISMVCAGRMELVDGTLP